MCNFILFCCLNLCNFGQKKGKKRRKRQLRIRLGIGNLYSILDNIEWNRLIANVLMALEREQGESGPIYQPEKGHRIRGILLDSCSH
jgi:hypothetical protein